MFSLHTEIRAYLDQNDERDPYLIAAVIRRMIPQSQHDVIFDELIAVVVKDVERALKNEAIEGAQHVDEEEESGVATKIKTGRRTGRVANSYKRTRQKHEVYQGILEMIVGVPHRFRKPFGACTRRDVIALKEMHYAYSDANRLAGGRYERVERLFDSDDDVMVEDLDDDELLDAMK